MTSFVVLKFGGTSVSSRTAWEKIRDIVQERLSEGLRPMVVCSALSQASNQLESILHLAPEARYHSALTKLIDAYQRLAQDLDVSPACLAQDIEQLTQLVEGVSLVKEASFRVQARVMAYGELLLTRLGVAFLEATDLSVLWCDAREWLQSTTNPNDSLASQYLSTHCAATADPLLQKACQAIKASVLVTQGFIANNENGETVLLGRGGSDVSASYLAAKVRADRCEIWTDVPGIYTANPQNIPEARHLSSLDYDEAQEIASMGAKVLHPNSIDPCRQANIPLHVKFTAEPKREGTIISSESDDVGVQIKSVLTKQGVLLISIETVQMWHQVGFLSEVFACFKQHGLSIDLVSTSESSVTVSLDRFIADKDPGAIDRVVANLNEFASAKVIAPCASVSLVGRHIRAILHQLGSIFEVFEAKQVYLLSQAANDLNLTFVVDEDQAQRLAKQLHTLLIDQNSRSQYLSKSWQEEFGQFEARPTLWWENHRETLLALVEDQLPRYVYCQEALVRSADALLSCHAIDSVFYAMKANNYPEILKQFYKNGLNFECVSLEEVELLFSLFPDMNSQRILFTPNFAAQYEYQRAFELGVHVTVDSLYPLKHWPLVFANRSILLRIDPGYGSGHHQFVVTGGNASKFGIPVDQLNQVNELIAQHQVTIYGLHIHAGSGILNPGNWRSTADILIGLLEQFPQVECFNLGGGLGVVERPGQRPLDMGAFNASLAVFKEKHPDIQLWLEPGRFLVAEAGVILATVTQLKTKGDTQFIGMNTGMNSLIRPALYGAYHEIVNLTRFHEPKKIMANIVGPICESGDTLGYSRFMPNTQEGDVLLIATAGAYGHVMGSHYNQRQPAAECFFTNGEFSAQSAVYNGGK